MEKEQRIRTTVPIISEKAVNKLFKENAPFATLDDKNSSLKRFEEVDNKFLKITTDLRLNCPEYNLNPKSCLTGMDAMLRAFTTEEPDLIEKYSKLPEKTQESIITTTNEFLNHGDAKIDYISKEQSLLWTYIDIVRVNNEIIRNGDDTDREMFERGAMTALKFVEQIYSKIS